MMLWARQISAPTTLLVFLVCTWLTANAHDAPHTHSEGDALPASAFTHASIYQLESTWITQSAQRMRLGDLRGKVRVLAMHYTSCEYACPIIISMMQNIEAALEPEVRDRVGFVAVTFDPERDTPAVLKAYSEKMRLDLQHWTLLHGEPEDVLELAVLLGIKFTKDHQGGFAHSNLITVLNKEGEIVHRHTGLHHPVANTLTAIRRVANQ
jgi:protein SCO1/2